MSDFFLYIELFLYVAGMFFVMVGSIGLVRFDDLYFRLHASGVADNAGFSLILLGLIVRSGFTTPTIMLALLILLNLVTNPIVTHSIAKSAFSMRYRPRQKEE